VDEGRAAASLRTFLRHETVVSHGKLDFALASLRLEERRDYARFLQVQLSARAPIERWAALHCPPDLRPPAAVPLLRADLAALGASADVAESRFDPPPGAHPLGLAWALAGSHLGNRALLARLTRSGARLPTAFLADPHMPAFWKALRPLLESPAAAAPAAAALAAAEAVFACFAHTIGAKEGKLAA